MKVMLVIHGLNTGGAETLVKEYALNLNKRTFNVVVLCFEHFKESPYEDLLQQNGVKLIYVCDFMKNYNKRGFYRYFNYIYRYLLVKKIIQHEAPDILHTHLAINSYIKFSKPKKGTRVLHTVHSEPSKIWDFNKKKSKKDFLAAKWLVKHYNMRFICLHKDMKNEVDKMFNVSNSIILNNGIDFTKFENPKSKNAIRKELHIPENAFVIGHVGRFSKVKNHIFLLDIFKEIYNKNNNSFLLMVGSGGEKDSIIKQLKSLKLDNNFLILENRMDIPDILNAMDLFVFPSLYEGLPISLIEAQKVKLPCFISDSINDLVVISNLVTKISLKESSSKWAKMILNYKYPDFILLNDKDWNIKDNVKKLEKIYMNKI